MSILIDKKNECCGCTACMNVCPTNAIKFEMDEQGFLYPNVNIDRCIECGACEDVCDFRKEKSNVSTVKEVYGLQYESKEVLRESTSGGAFTAISDIVLKEQGIVFGAVLDGLEFDVFHVATTDTNGRDKMRGSKYVQSDLKNTFQEVKRYLKKKRRVLFVGTPCQVAGLQSYLGDSYKELLVTVDMLCHGTPSVLLLKEHKKYLE